MTPVRRIQGVAAPLPLANVDTDVIIRIEHLGRCPREALGRWAFQPLRLQADGSDNPDFVLNQPAWRGAPILVTGPNFGCGSSREQAVWALQGMGIACVIAASFGDIFRSNCFQNGLLPITLQAHQVQALLHGLQAQHALGRPVSVSVDLESQTVTGPDGESWNFQIEARHRTALLEGLDAIGLTLTQQPQIVAWQAADQQRRPWIWR